MKTHTAASIIACSFLALLVQLVGLLIAPAAGIVAGGFTAIVFTLLFRFFEIELPQPWVPMVLPTVASLIGVLLVVAAKQELGAPYIWFAPLLSFLCALVIWFLRQSSSKRCALCNRRLRNGVVFDCPRCGLSVCDYSCWVFDSRRCRLCEQNGVPIFSADVKWWNRQLGPRTSHGRCQLCQTPAQESDLRPCRNCGRPQCRDCWDAANGECSRCHWTIEDLPESLRPYVSSIRESSKVAS